jgi:hypothetical protein
MQGVAMDRQVHLKLWSSLLALLLTLVAGWSGLKGFSFALFCLGIVGAIPMILIEGVHGGGTHLENMIGGVVFVVVNIMFYYFVLQWVLARMFRMRREAPGKS